MKANLHPTYHTDTKVTCSCGNSFVTGSTKPVIHVEICSQCHPFYTGEKRLVDTLGQVERFTARKDQASSLGYVKKADRKKQKQAARAQTPKSLRDMLLGKQ